METPDLSKIKRFALAIALMLITLVLAEVELETPVRIAPLGIPLVIRRPDLLTIGLLIIAVYSTLRYVYYGMLAQPSPMRARRVLLSGKPVHTPSIGLEIEEFAARFEKEVDRYFPSFGSQKVTFEATRDSSGCRVKLNVPQAVQAVCWIENLDFLLPIVANVAAVCLWGYARAVSS